ncbi:MAG: zf-HC2 domain-containing protein, partial [Candidatus Eremiobacteraeota bacterium]|nr:zf-HC2 domain-containing protein [Candidatus Eremiobacteraeota bacterium]
MTCNDCFEAFSCALDGELEPELQEAMNDHLESCADCRHLQTRMLSLSAEMKGQSFPVVPESQVRK